ncbi:glycosyl hydrolase family 17 protein [Candidatus Litorirhabdus singularis]|nr:glycosyl hydrolase family 17 protein [Candidatus Litorirhabdus singularis]
MHNNDKNWADSGNAICYSGYRAGQSPVHGIFPSALEIGEDLALLQPRWKFLRLYDCTAHAETVLQVIEEQQLDFKVMLGANMTAESSNPNCPWGAHFDEETLASNRIANDREIDRLIALSLRYPDVVFSVSIGNEASVDWSDHLVPVERLVAQTRRLKSAITQPVTFCENYVPWTNKLEPLARELDFISVHTYPVWEYQSIEHAMAFTQQNLQAVIDKNPDKPIVITEAGWTTASNGRGIEPNNASQQLQAIYCRELLNWSREAGILTFIFEAFDESWKGSEDPLEPEKHWGLWTEDRQPKLALQTLFANQG